MINPKPVRRRRGRVARGPLLPEERGEVSSCEPAGARALRRIIPAAASGASGLQRSDKGPKQRMQSSPIHPASTDER